MNRNWEWKEIAEEEIFANIDLYRLSWWHRLFQTRKYYRAINNKVKAGKAARECINGGYALDIHSLGGA